jgi:cytochrome c-type biogenesis protein
MEEFLTNLLGNSSIPLLSAFILGLLTAISPCPLATNIIAIGFIGKDLENRNRVFYSGLIYTAGRAISYTALALILYVGADQIKLSGFFQRYGEKIIGPLLIVIGLVMLGIIKLNFLSLGNLTEKFQQKKVKGYLDVLLLGVVFALAFCPYSGVLYFGMLIPLTITNASGLYLPIIYSIGTGIPVIIFAWIIAYTISGVGDFFNKLQTFEIWFRRVIAMVFLGVGLYYTITIFL